MRRRDFAMGLLLAAATQSVWAQERAKQHRIAIVIPAGPVAVISATSSDTLTRRFYQPFFEELRRLGDVEGQNLIVERYSGEGRPGGFADLAREVAGRNRDEASDRRNAAHRIRRGDPFRGRRHHSFVPAPAAARKQSEPEQQEEGSAAHAAMVPALV